MTIKDFYLKLKTCFPFTLCCYSRRCASLFLQHLLSSLASPTPSSSTHLPNLMPTSSTQLTSLMPPSPPKPPTPTMQFDATHIHHVSMSEDVHGIDGREVHNVEGRQRFTALMGKRGRGEGYGIGSHNVAGPYGEGWGYWVIRGVMDWWERDEGEGGI